MASDKILNLASVTGAWFDWPGGIGSFVAWGSHNGETVQLEARFDAETTATLVGEDVKFVAADGVGNFELGPCQVRGAINGAGATITAVLRPFAMNRLVIPRPA